MTEAEKILEKLPSVKIGLDDHYGKQTVLNALNQALSMSGVIKRYSQEEIDKAKEIAYNKGKTEGYWQGHNA